MSARIPASVPMPFTTPGQAHRAALKGLWLFLATELLLFGGPFAAVLSVRLRHPHAVTALAEHMKIWIGTANTALLLTSSLAVALAVACAQAGRRRGVVRWLMLALALGVVFLGLKGWEYWLDWHQGLIPGAGPPSPLVAGGAVRLLVNLYLAATALHALHMAAGLGLLAWTAWRVWGRVVPVPHAAQAVELTGLYWHLVDAIWVILFPLFYLAGR